MSGYPAFSQAAWGDSGYKSFTLLFETSCIRQPETQLYHDTLSIWSSSSYNHNTLTTLCTLCTPITNLFQACIQNQSLPTEWKVHKIRPIFKKENPLHVENYRPISLLCILSKVLEKIIYVKIIPFIRPRLSKHQFGFLRNRSCLTQF